MHRTWVWIFLLGLFGVLAAGCGGAGSMGATPTPTPVVTGKPEFLYAGNEVSANISAYSVNPTSGALTPLSGFPLPVGLSVDYLTHDPLNKFMVSVDTSANNIHVFAINASTGALTEIAPSPYAVGKEPRAAVIDPGGKFVYVASMSLNSVDAFTINASGVLTAVQGSPFPTGGTSTTGSFGCCVAVDPTGKFLFVEDKVNVYSFLINSSTGALSLVTTIPGPGFGNGLAVDPAGTFLYAAGSGNNSILTYAVNASTGALTFSFGSPMALQNGSFALVLDPAGPFAYTVENGASVVGYRLQTGRFTSLGESFSGALGTQQLAIDPTGSFLYAPQTGNLNDISGFQISQSGSLTAIAGSPFASGSQPLSVTIIPKQ
jgi:6-phosphogluconolactonase